MLSFRERLLRVQDEIDKTLRKDKELLDHTWKSINGSYKLKYRLGKGSSGEVVLARSRETKELVAIKQIKI